MLVLRRRAGEAIIVGGDVEIEVIEISRTRVKLGVKAPKEITVERREVLAQAAENRRASHLLPEFGADRIAGLLNLFRNLSEAGSQVSADTADK